MPRPTPIIIPGPTGMGGTLRESTSEVDILGSLMKLGQLYEMYKKLKQPGRDEEAAPTAMKVAGLDLTTPDEPGAVTGTPQEGFVNAPTERPGGGLSQQQIQALAGSSYFAPMIQQAMKNKAGGQAGSQFVGIDSEGQPVFANPRQQTLSTGTRQGVAEGPIAPKVAAKESIFDTFVKSYRETNPEKTDMEAVSAFRTMEAQASQKRYLPFTQVPNMPGYGYNRQTNAIEPMKMPEGIDPGTIADKKAATKSFDNLQKQYSMTKQVIDAADLDAHTLLKTSTNFGRSDYPAPNRIIGWGSEQFGSEEAQKEFGQFKVALPAFSRKYMRIVTGSARSVSELSVGAQATADDILSKFDSWSTLEAKVKQAQQEIKNEEIGYNNGLKTLREVINNVPGKSDAPEKAKPLSGTSVEELLRMRDELRKSPKQTSGLPFGGTMQLAGGNEPAGGGGTILDTLRKLLGTGGAGKAGDLGALQRQYMDALGKGDLDEAERIKQQMIDLSNQQRMTTG